MEAFENVKELIPKNLNSTIRGEQDIIKSQLLTIDSNKQKKTIVNNF